jgi:hypothetical protein
MAEEKVSYYRHRMGGLLSSIRYQKKEPLAGVIYLHRVSDVRFNGSAKTNLRTFQALCGPDYSPRVALVTTHWAEKGTRRYMYDVIRHETVEKQWWKGLQAGGAKVFALLDDTPSQAEPILDHILDIQDEGKNPLLQVEVGEYNQQIPETTAGRQLHGGITEFIEQLEEEKDDLQDQLDEIRKKIERINADCQLLKSRRAELNGDIFRVIRYRVLRF